MRALRFSSGQAAAPVLTDGRERHPCNLSEREWERGIGVLDRSGLTLPFFARMLAAGETARFPSPSLVQSPVGALRTSLDNSN